MSLKYQLSRNLSNLPGWRSRRKIVVIESDDWGSIRMPSKNAFETLKNKGVDILTGDNLRFNSYDTLASGEDLSALFEVLAAFKDRNGKPAVITPVSVMANPDFNKIRASNFSEYYYETFTETLKRIRGCENSFGLWKEGMEARIFVPEFHGREHLNVNAWLRALRSGDEATRIAFDNGSWGFNNRHPKNISYQAAFHTDHPGDIESHKEILADGLRLFGELLGYGASYFVAPNGAFSNDLLPVLAENGVNNIFTQRIRKGSTRTLRPYSFHYLGQKNSLGQTYITRNSVFEPSDKSKDWVDSCLADIAIAFRWKKPAIISSHRVNYIGSLDASNRSHGLKELRKLLTRILNTWADAEFMSSTDLMMLMRKS